MTTNSIPECKQQYYCQDNVVKSKRLHDIQEQTLMFLKDCLEKTYGPMGSYTTILKGEDSQSAHMIFSKDGKKVLQNILLSNPIEACLKSEIEEIIRHVEKVVGDATTSAVIISALVYHGLYEILENNKNVAPRMIIEAFKEIVGDIQNFISFQARNITLMDIYNICMISTNGNAEISKSIQNIYKEYGYDVDITVSISNDQYTKIKTYDGMSVDEGYAMPAFINTASGTSEIHNPRIYAFKDSIDTPELTSYMKKIIYENILDHARDLQFVPTVIMAPRIGRDASAVMEILSNYLLQFNKPSTLSSKPPILIVTNMSGTTEGIYLDIAKICGCKYIAKYIDPEVQKKDQEAGIAPTMDTLDDFAGTTELVVADSMRTQFINPDDLINGDKQIYNSIVSWLKGEIESKKELNDDKLTIGRLEKRLKTLEANAVEYFVGGIAVSDRDATKDLVEDAVKNCRSAAKEGFGWAANFEAYFASMRDYGYMNPLYKDIQTVIYDSYHEAIRILYSSVVPKEYTDIVIQECINRDEPIDVMQLLREMNNKKEITEEVISDVVSNIPSTGSVICSIRTDIEILDAISKIMSIIVTSNQCLLQSTHLNKY